MIALLNFPRGNNIYKLIKIITQSTYNHAMKCLTNKRVTLTRRINACGCNQSEKKDNKEVKGKKIFLKY